MHNLIPHFIYEQYQQGHNHGHLPATTLFLDISGFTAMTQALMQHGKEGAEVLADVINRVFDPIIKAVYERRGFITGFAGDAFTAVFPHDNQQTALATCATALKIRQTFIEQGHQQTKLGDFTLEVKQGLSVGKVEWGIVGSEEHRTYFFRGEAIDGCAKAEHQAKGGDIIIDSEIQALLPTNSVSRQTLDTQYAQLIELNPETEPPPPQPPTLPTIPQSIANQFFPQAVWQATQQGEFRDVATIFVSFQGAPDLATMNDFITQAMTIVDQYDGFFVEIDFGDKGGLFIVYFGAPITHENDVERALSFVLAMQSELSDVNLEWRAGMTYGTVYAGYVGIPLRDKYTCMGSIVNLAARLMVQAEWGQVLVSKSIALHPSFDFISLGQIAYKGFAQPVPTYLLKDKTIAQQVFQQKLVGREVELKQLADFAQPLFAGQNPGVAIIYGEAGIGKSHLIYSLGQTLGAKVRWLTGQCDPILREAFNPFVYFLKGYFGQVASTLDAAATEIENKVNFKHRLQDLLTTLTQIPDSQRQHDELVRTQSFLGALLDLYWPDSLYEQLDAKGRYENTMIAASMLLQAECRRQPVMLELEDGHWLDEDSHELLTAITRQTKDVPLLIVITSRYADDGSRPEYALDRDTPALLLELETLTAVAIQELAQEILGTPISADLQILLMEKAEANPFFAQQILYYLQENGLLQLNEVEGMTTLTTDNFELPTTLNALLVARLDRLTQEVREVVQTAAILGREFELRLLSQMLKRDIKREVVAGEQEQVWSLLNELQYIFKHILMRDAAYEMQLRTRLKELHYLAAVTGEQLYTQQLPTYYATLAYHYETAYRLGQTEARKSAIHYLRQAGQQAWGNFENETAVSYFSRALAIVPNSEIRRRYDLYLAREEVYDRQGNRIAQQADLEQLMHLVNDLSLVEQATLSFRQARYANRISDFAQTEKWVTTAVAQAHQSGKPELIIEGYQRWGYILRRQGNYLAAQTQLQTGLQWAKESGNRKGIANCLSGLGVVAVWQGEYTQAMNYYKQALTIQQEIGNRDGEGKALNGLGTVARQQGMYAQAVSYFEQVLTIQREMGNRNEEGTSLNALGSIAWYQRKYTQAVSHFEQALTIKREVGHRHGEGICLNNLGVLANDYGEYAQAVTYYEQYLTISREIGDLTGEGESLNNLGEVASIQGDYVTAEAHFGQALTVFRQIDYPFAEAVTLSNLGLLYHQMGQQKAALRHSQQAIAIARAVGIPYVLGYALTHLGHALTALGQQDEAGNVYQEAYTLRQEAGQLEMALESLAGLVRLALAQGDTTQTLAQAETIYAYLVEQELSSVAFDRMRVYWTCYQALQAYHDPRAEAILEMAYQIIQKQVAKLSVEMQLKYLQNVPSHRAIMAAWKEQQN